MLGTREVQGQDPVVAFGLDPFHIDPDRDGERTVELTRGSFAPMQARLIRVVHGFGAGDANHLIFDLDF